MITQRLLLTIFYLFSTLWTVFSQELRLAHFFSDERVRRIRMPNGEERFIAIPHYLPVLNVYTGNYKKLRTIDYSVRTNNERMVIQEAFVNELGSDTLVKFFYYDGGYYGIQDENGKILHTRGRNVYSNYSLSKVNGLKNRILVKTPINLATPDFCFYDTLNFGLQQCFTERNFIRANCEGLGERMVLTKSFYLHASSIQPFAVVMNENFDTLVKIKLPNKETNRFITHDFGLGTIPMFGVVSWSNPSEPSYFLFKMFDLSGNQRFSDSLANNSIYTQYAHLGKWLGKLEVSVNQNIADTTYSLLSLTDFSVLHQFKKVSTVQPINFGRAGEKILAYGSFGDTLYLYDPDFSLYRKIPVYPSFRGGSILHISDNLLNNDDEFEIFYEKSDFMTGRRELTIANSRAQHLLTFPNFSNFEISQIPGMKNKLLVIEGGTYVYELETETISSISNSLSPHAVVFPNPFSDNLTVKFSSNDETRPLSIRLFDLLGRQQRTWKMMENEFQLSNLSDMPKGIYFLEISNGEKKSIQKVIKQ